MDGPHSSFGMDLVSDRQLRDLIRKKVTKIEDDLIERRKHEGRRVVGWNAVVSKRYSDIPAKGEEFFGVKPTHSADDAENLAAAHSRRVRFLADYREALRDYLAGVKDVVFPFGTWLMRRIFKASCVPCAAAA